jgi:hypothetical protein
MGWSCRADAARTMAKWTAACEAQTGSQNVFEVDGASYFWELSRTEHHDGAITGSIQKTVRREGDRMWCRKVGTFRIEGDGTVTRAPKFLKDAS